MPNATEATVREVLDQFDGPSSGFALAVANGEFALWIGSGISRKAPDLGGLIDLGVEALRTRAIDPALSDRFRPKLEEALQIGEGVLEDLRPRYDTPFREWPEHSAIQGKLWGKYSRFLDIRVLGESQDFMLWEAVDIRAAFANPVTPAAEHLCIAILALEGAIREIASANWDGFIEAAVSRLSSGAAGVLQVVVDPNQLRGAGGTSRLLKFHGCIVHAAREPGTFRPYLTGSHTQIVDWPNAPKFAAMVAAVTGLATSHKSLVMGLSIQDMNLQGVFSAAKRANPWPWPPGSDSPGHVFCEDEIKDGQRDVLKIVYGDGYNENIGAIESASHIRAWAEQVLAALVLNVVEKKLDLLLRKHLAAIGRDAMAEQLAGHLRDLRNAVADLAKFDATDKSRTPCVEAGIAAWSRVLAVFRTGALPPDGVYERISASGLRQLGADANAAVAGLGNLAIAMSMLHQGHSTGSWSVGLLRGAPLESGAVSATGSWKGAPARPLFLVKGAAEALGLQKAGAFADDNAVVIHADATWSQMVDAGGSSRRVRGAPGRTGRVATRHLSIQQLLEQHADADSFRREFISEMSL